MEKGEAALRMLMVLIQLFNLGRKPPSDAFSFLLKKKGIALHCGIVSSSSRKDAAVTPTALQMLEV